MAKRKPRYPFGAGPTSGLPAPGLPASGVFGVGPADIGPQRPPSPRPPDPLADYPRVPTIDELFSQANKLADASRSGEQADLQTQRAQAAADAERRAAFQRDLAQALAQALGGVGPSIQGAYQEAARDQTTFAKGFSDGLRLLAEKGTGESNQFLGTVGSPQTIPSRSEAGDVLYGLGGYIPGQTFEREGAAFGAAGMMLPATALGIGQRQATAEISAGAEEQKKIDAQIRDLSAKRQAAFTDYLFKLQQQALSTQITRAEAKEQRRQFDLREKRAAAEAKAKAKADLLAEKSRTLLELAKLDQRAAALEETARYHDQTANDQTLDRGQRERAAEDAAAARAEANDIAREANDIRREQVRAQPRKTFRPSVDAVKTSNERASLAFKGWYTLYGDDAPLSTSDLQQLMKEHGATNLQALWQRGRDDETGEVSNTEDLVIDHKNGTYQETLAELQAILGPGSLGRAQQMLNRFWTKANAKKTGGGVGPNGYIYMGWEKPGEGRPPVGFQRRKKQPVGGAEGTTPTDLSSAAKADPATRALTTSNIVARAMEQIGQPYLWGGESRKEGGFDCSGLIDWAYRAAGIDLPGRLTSWTAAKLGRSVRRERLLPGDLIISNKGGHVTMYLGNGKVISSPRKGEVVQVVGMPSGIVDVRRLIDA